MNNPRSRSATAWVGLLVFAVGALWLGVALRGTDDALARIRRKLADHARLQEWARQAARDEQARQAILRMGAEPRDFLAVLQESIPEVRRQVASREGQPLADGWRALRVEANFEEIAFADLRRLLAHAENQRPPWRMAACSLTASEAIPGAAQATLLMECLQPAEVAP